MKKMVTIGFILYALFAIVNFFFVQGPILFNNYTELLGSSLLIFCSIAYYAQLLNAKEVIAIKNDAAFWISTGILINALGSVLGLMVVNFMNELSHDKAVFFMLLIQIAAVLAYLTFSIAFLCQTKKQ